MNADSFAILIVDDEPNIRLGLAKASVRLICSACWKRTSICGLAVKKS